MFELGEDLFDGIEIGAIGRQEQEMRTDGPDGGSGGLAFVRAEVVEDDDVAFGQRGSENLRDVCCENICVDRPVDHPRGVDAVVAQGGNEC